jgi:putative transposase
MSVQGGLSTEQMCRLADVSRSGFYRSYEVKMPVEDEVRLRALVQEIALEHRLRYGYRRVAAEVRRRGIVANHKRIARIMRVDNLLNMRPRGWKLTSPDDWGCFLRNFNSGLGNRRPRALSQSA